MQPARTPTVAFDVAESDSPGATRQWSQKLNNFQRRFSNVTNIHGIRSFSLFGQIFWFVLLLVCLCFAAHDVHDTWEAYYREDTITKIEASENQTIAFRKATLCTTVLPSEFDWAANFPLSNATFVREFLDSNVELVKTLGFFDQAPPAMMFHNDSSSTDPIATTRKRIVFLAVGLVLSITKLENRNWKQGDILDVATKFGFVNDADFYPNVSTTDAMVETYKFFLRNKVPVHNLVKPTVQWLCQLLSIHIDHVLPKDAGGRQEITNYPICNDPENVLWLAPLPLLGLQTAMCVRVPRKAFVFKMNSSLALRTVHVSYRPDGVYKPNSSVVDNSVLLYIDLEGHRTCTPLSRSCHGDLWQQSSFRIQIGSEYRFLDRARAPCVNRSIVVCLSSCRAALIRSKCNCWPMSYDWYGEGDRPKDVPFCGSVENETILANGKVPHLSAPACIDAIGHSWSERECEAKCYHRCQFTTIIWDREEKPHRSLQNADPSRRTVVYRLYDFTYPMIYEQLDIDGREYLAQLGAAFVLWIGLWTFIALMGIVFFPFFTYACAGRKGLARNVKNGSGTPPYSTIREESNGLSSRLENLALERENDKVEITKLNFDLAALRAEVEKLQQRAH